MLEKFDETIEQIVCDISQVKSAVETLTLFTDEIFDDLLCISEPNLKRYKNNFETNKIKAFAVMDYSEKAINLLKQIDEQTNPIYTYLLSKGATNNGSTEE